MTMSLDVYVGTYCCDNLKDHKFVFDSVMQTLKNRLLRNHVGQFYIQDILLCGSFSEGTRMKQFSGGKLEIEFDILARSSCPHNIPAVPQHTFHEFFMSVPAALNPAMKWSEFDYLEVVFQTYSNVKVLIDLHPAVFRYTDKTGSPVYDVLLPLGWRTSYVAKECSIIRSSPGHILPFRILKYIRQLIPEYARVPKYHLKMAVLRHIMQCPPNMYHTYYSCTVGILDYLLNSYWNRYLPSIHTEDNLLPDHGEWHFGIRSHWLKYAQRVLTYHFNDHQIVHNMFETQNQVVLPYTLM